MMSAAGAGTTAPGPDRIPFNLDKEYDLSKYNQRLKQQVNLVNPLRFFTSKKRILEAKEEVAQYKEKAKEGEVMLTQTEINRLRESNSIVGSAIHPDTQ